MIAYLRVSTEGQNLDQQRLAILDYAHKHRVTVDAFVATQHSSQHAVQRADLMQMIEALQPGDRLIVSELSRFGRSLSQILQIIDRLIQKEVRLVAIKEAIRFEGKHNLQTKAMIALFELFAEVERLACKFHLCTSILDVHFVSSVPVGAGLVPAQPRATTRVTPT